MDDNPDIRDRLNVNKSTYDNCFIRGAKWVKINRLNGPSTIHENQTWLKVAEHGFGSLWVYVICQIMAREKLQLTSWNLAREKYTDEKFCWQVKCDFFVDSMATLTIEYNLKISLVLGLHKIRSLDFPINTCTQLALIYHCHLKFIWPNFNRRVFRESII